MVSMSQTKGALFLYQQAKGEKAVRYQQKQSVKTITAYYELASSNKEKWSTFKDRYGEISRKKQKKDY